MYQQIIDQIELFDDITIFGHIHPDGDCYGSQISLKEMLSLKYPNKHFYAVGSGLPEFFNLIGKMDIVDDELIKRSLAIIIDSNDLNRIEDNRVFLAKGFAKIDHHIDLNTFKEGPQVVVDKASSTCELIYKFALENKLTINLKSAYALFLGILTDTGRFQYCSDFAEIFGICRELIMLGVKPNDIYEKLNSKNEESLKVTGYIYSHYKKTEGGTLYMVFNRSLMKELNIHDSGLLANSVTLLNNVKGYGIWLFIVEREGNRLKAELRSNRFNVQEIAASYGGGGHHHAAGMTIDHFDDEIINDILDRCDKTIAKGL